MSEEGRGLEQTWAQTLCPVLTLSRLYVPILSLAIDNSGLSSFSVQLKTMKAGVWWHKHQEDHKVSFGYIQTFSSKKKKISRTREMAQQVKALAANLNLSHGTHTEERQNPLPKDIL